MIACRGGRRWAKAALAVVMCVGTSAWAATDAGLPPVRTHGAVTYLSGGIGQDEQAAMKQAAGQYPLEVEFVETGPAHAFFSAGVQVTITDRAGNAVLDARSDGPFLLAMLPDGQYTITARNSASMKTRTVTIERDKHTRVVFDWRA